MRNESLDPSTQAISDLVQGISEKLVAKPEQLLVLARRERSRVVVQVMVGESDFGRLIGANGQTARALRCIAMAAAGKHRLTCDVNVAAYAS